MTVQSLKFTIFTPDGQRSELAVDSHRVLVGSGAPCEIRLPREYAAEEVLVIEVRGDDVFGEVRSFDPPPLIDGSPFTSGNIPEGSVITIGQCRLTMAAAEGGLGSHASGKKSSPLTMIIAVVLMGASGLMYVNAPKKTKALPDAPPPPSLWSEGEAGGCSERSGDPARVRAEELLQVAEGRRERAPFAVEDGMAAASFYEKAARCFKEAGETAAASSASGAASQLKSELELQYRVHQVALERALKTENFSVARRQAQYLQSFLVGRTDDYLTWLMVVDRTLQLKYESEKGKRKRS